MWEAVAMWLVFQWLEVEVAIDVWPYMWSEIALVLAEEENEMAEAWFGVCMAFLYFLGGLEVLTRHDGFLGVMHEFRS